MKRGFALGIIYFSLICISLAQNTELPLGFSSGEVATTTENHSKKILFTYFNDWTSLATLTYFTTIDGETEVTVGTDTRKTKIKTEMKELYWVKKSDDPKWIFEVFKLIIDCAITVNGNTTHVE